MTNELNDFDDATYPYKGVPITPAIAQRLIKKLLSGKLLERQIIIDEVLRTHLSLGGLKSLAQNQDGTFKKALGDMRANGEVENPTPGWYRIFGVEFESDRGNGIATEPEPIHPPSSVPTDPVAELEVGFGSSAVYLYYLPTYRLRAEDKAEEYWPCKIGRTDRDPLSRVLAQAATALPERPVIAIVIRTDHPSAWENALHGILRIRGRQIEDSPGVEWFLTSPNEVCQLVTAINPSISPAGGPDVALDVWVHKRSSTDPY